MAHEKQHIVPEFLLRGFTASGTNRVYGFDKSTGKVFPCTPEKAAKESGFYDFQIKGLEVTFEESLGKLESQTAPIVQKLLTSGRIAELSDPEKAGLGFFCTVQMVRDKNSLASGMDFRDKLREKMKRMGAKDEDLRDLEDEKFRTMNLLMLKEAPKKFLPFLFFNKSWSLLAAPQSSSLYISDSPVTLTNSRTFGPYGNLGLALPGIQINLPLSATFNLWISCITIENEQRSNYQKAALAGIRTAEPSMREVKQMLDAFQGKHAFQMKPENVTWLNSLQVEKAERFIYFRDEDFSLAKRMLKDHPEFKQGRRMKFG